METSKDLQNNSANIAVGENPKAPKKKMSGKKIALIALGGVVAFIAIIIVIANIATNAPVKVSDQLMSNIKNNKPIEGYSLLSAEAKATISSDDFTATLDKISPYLTGTPNLQSKEINTSTSNGTTAKVIYEIKGSDATYTFTVNLREVNGQWQVDSFESKAK